MDTIESTPLTTADLPADMQAPGLRPAPVVVAHVPVEPRLPHVLCEHGWYGCDECPDLLGRTYTG